MAVRTFDDRRGGSDGDESHERRPGRGPAPQLAGTCIQGLVARTGVPVDQADEVIMGNAIAAGLGMNPARQASI